MTRWISLGFVAAAAYNIVGMVVFTRGFTNQVLFAADPELFSRPACAVVCIWGLAYLSLAAHANKAPYVALAFAAEKLFYAAWWARWISLHHGDLMTIRANDLLAGMFYGVYGVGDAAFAAFFAVVFWKFWR